jgi:AraC-like DNA-binding protein
MRESQLHLWAGRAVHRGQGYASQRHQHHAIQLGCGVGPSIGLSSKNGAEEIWSGFCVTPDVEHCVDASDEEVLFVWSENLAVLKALAGHPGLFPLTLSQGAQLRQTLGGDLAQLSGSDIDTLVLETLGIKSQSLELDEKASTTLQTLQNVMVDDSPRPLSQLARNVGLSESRLRHFFREQVGMSLQSYRLWQRLFLVLQLRKSHDSLTEAVHSVGFADSAHFSRVFKACFGLKPSLVLRSHSVQVFIHDSL